MFQPTNPSYIHAVVEATIDRHVNESQEELAFRLGRPYRESLSPRGARRLLDAFRSRLSAAGHWLSNLNAHIAAMPHRQTGAQ